MNGRRGRKGKPAAGAPAVAAHIASRTFKPTSTDAVAKREAPVATAPPSTRPISLLLQGTALGSDTATDATPVSLGRCPAHVGHITILNHAQRSTSLMLWLTRTNANLRFVFSSGHRSSRSNSWVEASRGAHRRPTLQPPYAEDRASRPSTRLTEIRLRREMLLLHRQQNWRQ